MVDTELYQQVLGLTAPWWETDVRFNVETTEIQVHVEHPEGCRWNCPPGGYWNVSNFRDVTYLYWGR